MVITGVSRGLGAALFHELRASGDRILALGRRFTEAQNAAERADPQRIRLRPTDLTYPAALPGAAELSSFTHDASEVVLIHNAGVLEPVGAIGTLPPDQIQHAVMINLTAPMLLTNALLGAALGRSARGATGSFNGFATAGGAATDGPAPAVGSTVTRPITVLFISSGAATRPVAGWSVYSATKRAGESFFESLAAQHADDPRIRIINVNPGTMDTDMQAVVRGYASRDVYFPDGGRFLDLHQRGALTPPDQVARRIIAEHLTAA